MKCNVVVVTMIVKPWKKGVPPSSIRGYLSPWGDYEAKLIGERLKSNTDNKTNCAMLSIVIISFYERMFFTSNLLACGTKCVFTLFLNARAPKTQGCF